MSHVRVFSSLEIVGSMELVMYSKIAAMVLLSAAVVLVACRREEVVPPLKLGGPAAQYAR